jgi:hypothetical protein
MPSHRALDLRLALRGQSVFDDALQTLSIFY